MEKKYIIYIGGFILPDGNAAAHRVLANGKILRNLGYKVIFLGTEKNKPRKDIDFLSNKKMIEGFSSYNIPYPKSFKGWLHYLYSIKELKKLIKHVGSKKIDSIIAYNYQAIALKRLSKVCKELKIKLVADCTEWQVVKRDNILISLLKNMDTFYRMKILHKKLDGIIVISSFLFNYYKLEIKNIILLPPLVDLKDKKWQNNLDSKDENWELIYSGSPGKGSKDRIDQIVMALSLIKDKIKEFTFTIVGISKEEYINNFGQEYLPSNLKGNLVFLGRIGHKEAIKTTQRSDFTIFLRDINLITTAGFPTKFVESISCGVPVLTNSSSNISDYLKNGTYGFLLDSSNSESLEKSLYKALILSKEDVRKRKEFCKKSKLFDYNNYQDKMKFFMDNLYKI